MTKTLEAIIYIYTYYVHMYICTYTVYITSYIEREGVGERESQSERGRKRERERAASSLRKYIPFPFLKLHFLGRLKRILKYDLLGTI